MIQEIFSLSGKKGFITGGAGGIGKCLSEAFLDAGADIAIVDINAAAAQKVTKELTGKYQRKVISLSCDVSDAKDCEKMVKECYEQLGSLDFALANAGIFTPYAAIDISADDFKSVIEVDLNGCFFTCQAAARLMKEKNIKGSIVSTSSISGHIINVPQTLGNYCAAKAAVIHLTKVMAVEWAKYGIRVNAVSPGYINTEMLSTISEYTDTWMEKIPMNRFGLPKELIGAFLYLVSDASTYTTGIDIIVDGGYTCL